MCHIALLQAYVIKMYIVVIPTTHTTPDDVPVTKGTGKTKGP